MTKTIALTIPPEIRAILLEWKKDFDAATAAYPFMKAVLLAEQEGVSQDEFLASVEASSHVISPASTIQALLRYIRNNINRSPNDDVRAEAAKLRAWLEPIMREHGL